MILKRYLNFIFDFINFIIFIIKVTKILKFLSRTRFSTSDFVGPKLFQKDEGYSHYHLSDGIAFFKEEFHNH